MVKILKLALLLIITLQIKSGMVDECKKLNCKICCAKNIDGIYYCSELELTCKLISSEELFNSLYNSLFIFLGLVFGIPLTLFFFNILFLKKIGILKMSLCEFFFNSICLCSCLKKIKKKKKIFEDIDIKYDFNKNESELGFGDSSLMNLKIQ